MKNLNKRKCVIKAASFLLFLCLLAGCSSNLDSNVQIASPKPIKSSSSQSTSVPSQSENPELNVSWEVMPDDLLDTGENARLNLTIKNPSNISINGISIKTKLSNEATFDVADAFTQFNQKDGYMIFYDDQKFDPDCNMGMSISIHPKKSGNFSIPFYFYSLDGTKSIKVNGKNSSISASFSVAKVASVPSFSK